MENIERQLEEVGKKLLHPPVSVDELLPVLDQVERLLSKVDQSPKKTMLDALKPSMKALIQDDLLRHSDVDVKIAVASCISQIMRITAPDEPYNDDQMRDVFQLIVSSFEDLADQSSRSYIRRVSILETVASVRSCVIMLDLECDGMIVEMFEHFLRSVRDYHRGVAYSSMEHIMIVVLKESDDISVEMLKPLLATVKKHNEGVLPIAQKLVENVLKESAEKLKPYLMPALTALGDSLDSYTEIVTRVCEGTTATTNNRTRILDISRRLLSVKNDANASWQQREVKRPATIDSSSDSDHKPQEHRKKAVVTKKVILPATIDSSNNSDLKLQKQAGKKAVVTKEVKQPATIDLSSDSDHTPQKHGKKAVVTKEVKLPATIDSSGTSSNRKRKCTLVKDKESETIKYDESLVGKKVIVWWSEDKEQVPSSGSMNNLLNTQIANVNTVACRYYEGVIESFDAAKKKHKVSYVDGNEENLCLKNQKWAIIQNFSAHDKERKRSSQKNLGRSQTESGSRVTTSIFDPPSANTPVLVDKIECPLMQAHTLKVPISSSLGETSHNLLTPLSNVDIEKEDDQVHSSSPKRVGFISSNTFFSHYSPSRVIASHESLATTAVVVPSGILQGSAGGPDVVNINKASSGHLVESPTKVQTEGFTCDLPVSATTPPPSIPLPSMPLSTTANDSTSHFMSVMLSQFDHMGSKLDGLCMKVDHLDKSVTQLNSKVDSLHEKYDSTIAKLTTRDTNLSKEEFNLRSGYMSDTRKNKRTQDDPDCDNHEGEKRGKRVRSENIVSGQVKRSSKENTSQEGIREKESSKQSGKKVGAGESDVKQAKQSAIREKDSDSDSEPLNSVKKVEKSDSGAKPLKLSAKKGNASTSGDVTSSSKKKDDRRIRASGKIVLRKAEASDDEMDVSPKSAKKPAKGEGNLKATSGTSSKRKRTPLPVQDKESDTIKYDESLVGKKVKVWWPKDKEYYEGVIKSYDAAKKKHKVSYVDGDEKNLCMRNYKWEIVQNFSARDKPAKNEEESDSDSEPLKCVKKVEKRKPTVKDSVSDARPR